MNSSRKMILWESGESWSKRDGHEGLWTLLLPDVWMFNGHFSTQSRLNGPSDPKGKEAKWTMKHPSDMPTARFELWWLKSVANQATSYTMEAPRVTRYKDKVYGSLSVWQSMWANDDIKSELRPWSSTDLPVWTVLYQNILLTAFLLTFILVWLVSLIT
jgi:hypothetical protein